MLTTFVSVSLLRCRVFAPAGEAADPLRPFPRRLCSRRVHPLPGRVQTHLHPAPDADEKMEGNEPESMEEEDQKTPKV